MLSRKGRGGAGEASHGAWRERAGGKRWDGGRSLHRQIGALLRVVGGRTLQRVMREVGAQRTSFQDLDRGRHICSSFHSASATHSGQSHFVSLSGLWRFNALLRPLEPSSIVNMASIASVLCFSIRSPSLHDSMHIERAEKAPAWKMRDKKSSPSRLHFSNRQGPITDFRYSSNASWRFFTLSLVGRGCRAVS